MTSPNVRTAGGLVVLLGAWGGLVPFVGPLFNYPMPPGSNAAAFTWSTSNLQFHVLPAIAVVLGGLGIAAARSRGGGGFASVLAIAGGFWFVLAPVFAPLWLFTGGGGAMGAASPLMQVLTPLGYHHGTGLLIAALAAATLGALGAQGRAPAPRTRTRPTEREPERVP